MYCNDQTTSDMLSAGACKQNADLGASADRDTMDRAVQIQSREWDPRGLRIHIFLEKGRLRICMPREAGSCQSQDRSWQPTVWRLGFGKKLLSLFGHLDVFVAKQLLHHGAVCSGHACVVDCNAVGQQIPQAGVLGGLSLSPQHLS